MKLLIALKNNEGLESELSEHFGHCPYFAVYDKESKNLQILENFIDHTKDKTPVEQTLKLNIDAVFSLGIGRRAIDLFSEKGVELMTGDYTKLGEVIDNINNLKKLDDACEH